MMRRFDGEFIEVVAVNPDGDLACDITLATPDARSGLSEALRASFCPPATAVPNGIEARFHIDAWDDLMRYVELESRCCSFLTLALRREPDAAVLTITGRPEAQDWIRALFHPAG